MHHPAVGLLAYSASTEDSKFTRSACVSAFVAAAVALKAKFGGFTYHAKQESFLLTFNYAFENTTNKDYTFPPDTAVFEKMAFVPGYGQAVHAEIVGNTFIPAHHEMTIDIQCTYNYDELGTTFQDTVDDKNSEVFVFKRLNHLERFKLLDKENRYEIDLPNEWTQWDKVKNAFADEHKAQEVKVGTH